VAVGAVGNLASEEMLNLVAEQAAAEPMERKLPLLVGHLFSEQAEAVLEAGKTSTWTLTGYKVQMLVLGVHILLVLEAVVVTRMVTMAG